MFADVVSYNMSHTSTTTTTEYAEYDVILWLDFPQTIYWLNIGWKKILNHPPIFAKNWQPLNYFECRLN